jgi:glycosyltransferase involved in cell wall biosynthesis
VRIVHLSTSGFRGGAGRGLLGVHQGLLNLGIDSIVLAGIGLPIQQPDLRAAGGLTKLVVQLDGGLLQTLGGGSSVTFSTNLLPTSVPHAVRKLRPDIVHYHWVGSGLLSPRQLASLSADFPCVWTLRDMWPFTGGCHYAGSCKGFEQGCGSCPALGRSSERDLSSKIHRSKQRTPLPESLRVVALSRWLADLARTSSLMSGRVITVIPPGVDLSVFHAHGRRDARRRFGIAGTTPVVGFVALHPYTEARKGFRLLDEALSRVTPLRPDLVSLITADLPSESRSASWRGVGTIEEEDDLRQLYQTCDVVVVPSTDEAFGKVTLEAVACGTPVVLFADTGGVDVIDHLRNGYVAARQGALDLSVGINWALESKEQGRLGATELAASVAGYDLNSQAAAYVKLYREIRAS